MDNATHRLMMAVSTGAGVLKTVTLKWPTTSWTAPTSTTRLESVVGKGGDGTPEEDYYVPRYTRQTQHYYQVRHDGSIFQQEGGTTTHFGYTPTDYCDPTEATPSDPTFSAHQVCYYHTDISYWDTDPATTGSNTTGFGFTFPGGVGQNATPVTQTNVTVTPGQSYTLNISSSNGSITISYYE